jgi:hypothetical protein
MSVALAAPAEIIDHRIYTIRNQRVMLDRDLAELYGVKAIALRQQVRRNIDRFPEDFLFQLTGEEVKILLSQNVIPDSRNLGGSKPFAFTEQGVAMLSSVLTSKRALQVNIAIIRAFVRMREMWFDHQDLLRKIQDMELRYDDQFQEVFDAIRALTTLPEPPKRPIGFVPAPSNSPASGAAADPPHAPSTLPA